MLIATEVNRGMRAARLALQKGEQTLLHGRAEMSKAELWNIYRQLSNEIERKLDTSVEQVIKKDRRFILFSHYIRPKQSAITHIVMWPQIPDISREKLWTLTTVANLCEEQSPRNTACHHILNPNWAISIIMHLHCFNSK